MRYLVYLLLVANLVYLGWNLFDSPTTPEQAYYIPPLPASVHRLVTLDERPEAKAQQVAEAQQVADAQAAPAEAEVTAEQADEITQIEEITARQPPAAGLAVVCQALGPFLAVEDMEKVGTRLNELGLEPEQRELQSKKLTGYWVYLPAMSRAEVKDVLEILKKHKDKEYYVGKSNFVSLGTFRGPERAKRRLKQVQAMGLDAVMKERFKTESAWWLDIKSNGAAVDELGSIAKERPELHLVDLACY